MTNQKSLDKKKTKELDWEKEFDEKLTEIHGRRLPKMVKSFIQSLLSTQRQEILGEILDLVDKLHMPVGRRELEEEIKSLVKK